MAEMLYGLSTSSDLPEPLTYRQREVLESALAKMVLVGARAGVSTDQMIDLLESGMTVRELVEYVFTLAGNEA